ncbi:methyltransferase C-terminal domain-containing protein [Gryllotalpicola reticulitermitis]|uniref:Methyltransferase C-terminal domain-containing protein n=1 Tax=Gryllotalpicola reticulitermitis TaxID=1184153 RepID=A0ABV8Q8L5_9MICO
MSDLPLPISSWRDRWSGSPDGVVVLDLGLQPAGDNFPRPEDPEPDARFPLRMVISTTSGLIQLEDDPTTPEEVRGIEPRAVLEQAEDAVTRAAAAGYLIAGTRVIDFPSPHGGSWNDLVTAHGLTVVEDGEAELVVDNFGVMHDADQRAGFAERVRHVAPDGILLMHFHDIAAVVRHGMWNALKNGHFGLYSAPALVSILDELGFVALEAWRFSLYNNGSVVMAFARKGGRWGSEQGASVTALVEEELTEGITDPAYVATLGQAVERTVRDIQGYLTQAKAQGLRIAGYAAASRTAALLCAADITTDKMVAIADGSPAKHGLTMPVNRIPIVSPDELVALRPDRVLLFVPDLLAEMRERLPEIEANGGRWVLIEPEPVEVEPLAQPEASLA